MGCGCGIPGVAWCPANSRPEDAQARAQERQERVEDGDLRRRFSHPFFAGHVGEAFAWADQNGDGVVQVTEMRFAPVLVDGKRARLQSSYWGQLPGPDGTVPYVCYDPQAVLKLTVTGYTPCGAPVYDPARLEVVKPDQQILQGGEGMTLGGSDGVVYLNQSPLTAVDRTGHVLFTYPSRNVSVHGSHTAKSARPGYLIGPSSILGAADFGKEIGEVFDLNGNLGENYLFTRDGLWVQGLFRDIRGGFTMPPRAVRGMSLDDITAGSESFGGNFVRTAGGKTYLTIGGTDARVLEVTGLESIHRFGGTVAYTPAEYQEAQRQLVKRAARAAEPKTYTVARAATVPAIDGKPDDWPDLLTDAQPAMDVADSPDQRYGRVLARYDERSLYLAYRVFAPSNHMRNAGQDDRLLFKTGDAVDLMLGPEPQKGLSGDLRLLMTVKAGQPVAILNQQVAPGAAAGEHHIFSSWRTLAFDRVAVALEARVATGPLPGGYLVEAAIPWTTLGVQPHPGLKLRADVGVLFADAGGTATVSRQYWSNKATALVSDIPGEAELTPALWGAWELR